MLLQDIPQEILNNIFAYLSPVTLQEIGFDVLGEFGSCVVNVIQYNQYWKYAVETLLGKYLHDNFGRNWFDVYRNMTRNKSKLECASTYGYADIVKVILAKLSNNKNYTNSKYHAGLNSAASNNHLDIVRLFLSDHHNNFPSKELCRIGFFNACRDGYTDMVRLLLKDKRIKYKDSDSLYEAVRGNHSGVVRLLLDVAKSQRDNLVHLYELSNINKSLIEASRMGYTNIVTMLLEDKRIHHIHDINQAFQIACKSGRINVVRTFLVDRGIDRLVIGWSALDDAVSCGYYDIVKLLLKDGRADPTLKNSAVLQTARARGYSDIATLLTEACAQIKAAIVNN